jgi:hypothetical protein
MRRVGALCKYELCSPGDTHAMAMDATLQSMTAACHPGKKDDPVIQFCRSAVSLASANSIIVRVGYRIDEDTTRHDTPRATVDIVRCCQWRTSAVFVLFR